MTRDVMRNADGSVTELLWDDDGVTINQRQRVDHIMDGFRHETDLGHNARSAGRLAARVPLVTHMEWVNDWKANHSDKWDLKTFLAMKINSSDFKKLRNQRVRG